jgi:exodeoxyribonuclease VII small subunit
MSSLFAGDEKVADSPLTEKTSQPAAQTGGSLTAPPKQEATKQQDGMRFEDAFSRLESLVGEMERGELPLEQMLDRFEEGVRLVRHCNEFLSQAQLRVERYVEQKDGHWVLKEEKAKG